MRTCVYFYFFVLLSTRVAWFCCCPFLMLFFIFKKGRRKIKEGLSVPLRAEVVMDDAICEPEQVLLDENKEAAAR